jgi:hypothetical protein
LSPPDRQPEALPPTGSRRSPAGHGRSRPAIRCHVHARRIPTGQCRRVQRTDSTR